MRYAKRVVTGNQCVDVVIDSGSIWLSIKDGNDKQLADTSCSREAAIALATTLLNAANKLEA